MHEAVVDQLLRPINPTGKQLSWVADFVRDRHNKTLLPVTPPVENGVLEALIDRKNKEYFYSNK